MNLNKNISDKGNHVKFVSYTGKFPNLCSGVLTLSIDGKEEKFGQDTNYKEFWSSGGGIRPNWEGTEHGRWNIEVEDIPSKFRKYADEIERVFNYNVPFGCCGGCI